MTALCRIVLYVIVLFIWEKVIDLLCSYGLIVLLFNLEINFTLVLICSHVPYIKPREKIMPRCVCIMALY
jgi:hypothetical protein